LKIGPVLFDLWNIKGIQEGIVNALDKMAFSDILGICNLNSNVSTGIILLLQSLHIQFPI
jgi:hypothetical protein